MPSDSQEGKPASSVPLTYAAAGVDIARKMEGLERAKRHIRTTFTPQVVSDVGAFGSMFALAGFADHDALLVASTDSVGTKLMVATMVGRHNTVGRDIVSHCVNDILVQGARPLFFMDYIAASVLSPEFMEQLIEGLATGCRHAGCALIGGETAELPGVYQQGEYDLVGFVVGAVSRTKAITGDTIKPGDALLALASDGLHTNGYSLARKVFFEVAGWKVDHQVPELGRTIGEELLRVHRCYAPSALPLLDKLHVKGMAHITGGGLPDNLIRCLPEGCRAVAERKRWEVPPIFKLIQQLGRIADQEMFHVFNMGVGLVLVLDPADVPAASAHLSAAGESVFPIGHIEPGDRGVVIV